MELCASPSTLHPHHAQVLRVMELCAGAGGTSFVCQEATMHGKKIELRALWSFDINEDASATYQINEPHTHV